MLNDTLQLIAAIVRSLRRMVGAMLLRCPQNARLVDIEGFIRSRAGRGRSIGSIYPNWSKGGKRNVFTLTVYYYTTPPCDLLPIASDPLGELRLPFLVVAHRSISHFLFCVGEVWFRQ
jgi:hypothetical protein